MANFCANCGAKIQEASKFCSICGTKIDTSAAPAASSAASAAPPAASAVARSSAAAPMPAAQSALQSVPQPEARQTEQNSAEPRRMSPPVASASTSAPRPARKPAPLAEKLRRKYSADQAKPAKSLGCLRGCCITLLIMFFIAGLGALFTVKGCRNEEPPKPDSAANTAVPRDIVPPEYHSAAFTREIQKGVVLSVPENALGRSKKLDVKPVAKPNALMLKADKQLKERGVIAVAAWEVDAGLAEDERLPGYYTLRVDLGELGIDESLYSRVRFYRLTDKGGLYEYSTAIDGRTASFRSNQNSFVLAAVCMGAIVLPSAITVGTYAKEYVSERFYYCFQDGDNWYLECSNDSGTFRLYWNGSEVDKDFYERMRKLKERYNEIIRREQRKHNGWFEYAAEAFSFGINSQLSKAAQEALDKDAEFQELKKQIKHLPPFIERTSAQITTAYVYLGQTVKVKMPGYTVCFYLKKDLKALGYQNSTLLRNPYIDINLRDDLLKSARSGGETWDNLLLTVTHELFHICQEEYHFRYGVKSVKFDEMVTVLLESDALDYYKSNKIITTTPELTSSGADEYLYQYPMDKDEEGDKAGQYGYALSKFVVFIREKSGKSTITAKNLMEAREYNSRPNISDPLKKCFDINSVKLSEYFVAYCRHAFTAIAHGFDGAGDMQLVKAVPVRPVPVSMNFTGPFSCRMAKIFLPEEKDCAVVIVPQDGAEQAVLCFDPSRHPSQLKRGVFVPSPKATRVGEVMMIFPPGKAETLKTGFTAYAVPAPKIPYFNAEKTYIDMKVPELSAAGKAGITSGFILSITPSGGSAKNIKLGRDCAGQKKTFVLSEVFSKLKPGTLKFTASICEYVLDNDGKPCLGPKSKEITASVVVPEPETEETPEPEPEPSSVSPSAEGGSGEVYIFDDTLDLRQIRPKLFYIDGKDFSKYLLNGKALDINPDGRFSFSVNENFSFNNITGKFSFNFAGKFEEGEALYKLDYLNQLTKQQPSAFDYKDVSYKNILAACTGSLKIKYNGERLDFFNCEKNIVFNEGCITLEPPSEDNGSFHIRLYLEGTCPTDKCVETHVRSDGTKCKPRIVSNPNSRDSLELTLRPESGTISSHAKVFDREMYNRCLAEEKKNNP